MDLTQNETDLIDLFKSELKLCKVEPGETVAILSEGDNLHEYARAFLAAAEKLGANVIEVNVAGPPTEANERLKNIGKNSLGENAEAMAKLKSANMVVDLMLLLFSREQIELQKAGARILLCVEPVEILRRLLPTKDLRRRVEVAEKLLKEAKVLRFTNKAGTDITYELNEHQILSEYGYTDTPGRWDHWPGGFLATYASGDVNGRVVMAPGDIIYPFKEFVKSPIEFSVKNGQVVDIRGDGDAKRLREYMDSFEDSRAYAISHIGWGLNERCEWRVDLPGIGMDGRAYYGNVLFSTGPNTEFGGDNNTACHLDLPMRDCTLYLDGDVIVNQGEIVPREMRA